MNQIHLNDDFYQQAQRRAAEVGFGRVDEFVADLLRHELEESANLDHFFTADRLAHVDRAIAQIEAGQGVPSEQVRERFRRKREA